MNSKLINQTIKSIKDLLSISNFNKMRNSLSINILTLAVVGYTAVTTMITSNAAADTITAVKKEDMAGFELMKIAGSNILGGGGLVLNFVAIPICCIVVVIKLIMIVVGFMGGGQGSEMATHIKHIFIAMIIGGIILYLTNGNNLINIMLPANKAATGGTPA